MGGPAARCARRGMRAQCWQSAMARWGSGAPAGGVPEAREGRCWFHKTANVLAALPSLPTGSEEGLAEIWNAEDKPHALAAVKEFEAAYGAKFPKATAKITDDVEELLAFCDYQAEHWVHLRTTNEIESTFATVRHRTKVTKGPGSRAAGLAMAFKLIESAKTAGAPSTRPISSPWSRRGNLHQRQTCRTAQREGQRSAKRLIILCVVEMSECPSRSLTTAKSAPPASSQDACAWRRSWTLTWIPRSAVLRACIQMCSRNHLRGMWPSVSAILGFLGSSLLAARRLAL